MRILLPLIAIAFLLPAAPAAAQLDLGVSCTYVYDGGPGNGVQSTQSPQGFASLADCETQAKNEESSALGQPAVEKKRCTCSATKEGGASGASLLDNAAFRPLGDTTLQGIIGRVIKFILGLTGVIALVMVTYGGFLWMTAAGSSDNISKAKSILLWSILGIVLIFSAYALVDLVIRAVS
jgi:hypothetical protein